MLQCIGQLDLVYTMYLSYSRPVYTAQVVLHVSVEVCSYATLDCILACECAEMTANME